MNKQTTTSKSGALLRIIKATFTAALLPTFMSLLSLRTSQAGSATWNLNPASGDWNTAANWTPTIVPNGSSDTASFGASNTVNVSLSDNTEVSAILINSGASAFTMTADDTAQFTISGAGITNNSGLTQRFITANSDVFFNEQVLEFSNNATAGSSTSFTNNGSIGNGVIGGWTYFTGHSNADHASFTNNGGTVNGTYGGAVVFYDFSNASHATITNNGGTARDAYGGRATFVDRASAGSATIINNGGTGGLEGGNGGYTEFFGASAGEATLIAKGGTDGNDGGLISFIGADGGTARVELFDYGTLDLQQDFFGVVGIGSLEGDGIVLLGHSVTFSVGTNSRSTTFLGVIKNGINDSGSLTKVGSGTLTLSGTNTYMNGTVVTEGGLVINTTTGSGTGTGAVQVTGGSLGGRGNISGDITVGSGSGSGALLAPSAGTGRPATLRIYSSLTFKADGTYVSRLYPNKSKADTVVANGVTIGSGALFSLVGGGSAVIAPGTVFALIRNNGATAISGAFTNLPDGSTLTVGSNTFQADYEGGDGNDLTLTVVP